MTTSRRAGTADPNRFPAHANERELEWRDGGNVRREEKQFPIAAQISRAGYIRGKVWRERSRPSGGRFSDDCEPGLKKLPTDPALPPELEEKKTAVISGGRECRHTRKPDRGLAMPRIAGECNGDQIRPRWWNRPEQQPDLCRSIRATASELPLVAMAGQVGS